MKNVLYLLLAVFAISFTSCGKDGGGEETANITVPNQNQLTQTAYADNTATSSGVAFTTLGAWTSEISGATKAGASDWVNVSPSSGSKAGNYTINITLGENFTGKSRTAKITIICGTDKITITVSQNGETSEGKIPEDKPAEVAVSSVTLDKSELSLEIDQTVTLTSTINPADATNKSVVWSSSNESVAKVDSVGLVKAIADGEAIITVKSVANNAITASCAVTVKAKETTNPAFSQIVTKINGGSIIYSADYLYVTSFGEEEYVNKRYDNDIWAYVSVVPYTDDYGYRQDWGCYFEYGNESRLESVTQIWSRHDSTAESFYYWNNNNLSYIRGDQPGVSRSGFLRTDLKYGTVEYNLGNIDINWLLAASDYYSGLPVSAIAVRTTRDNHLLVEKTRIEEDSDGKYDADFKYRYVFDSFGRITEIWASVYWAIGGDRGESKIYIFEYETR